MIKIIQVIDFDPESYMYVHVDHKLDIIILYFREKKSNQICHCGRSFKINIFLHFRFVVSGPLIHQFYILLDKMMPPKKEKATALDGIKRVIVDRLVFAPPFLLLFLYVITILEVSRWCSFVSRSLFKSIT